MQAKGQYDIAQADLDAQRDGTPAANKKLLVKKADVAYDIAKAQCGDLKGNPKAVYLKEAKAAHVSALADANTAKVAANNPGDSKKLNAAKNDAAEDKSDAAYAVEKQRCDGLTGDGKDTCLRTVKTRFGK